MKRTAFTMAEVLVTLGIIGIVAAMTLPSVIRNYKTYVLASQLKKGYSTISQALTMMYADTGEDITYDRYPNQSFVKAFQQYLIKNRYATGYGITGTDKDDYYNSTTYKNYNNTNYADASLMDEGQIILNDGLAIFIQNSQYAQYGLLITIDVNGIKKRPNRWGHDLFTFRVTNKGTLIPSEAPTSTYVYGKQKNYCSKNSQLRENGLACTYYAINDICPDDSRYSYWKCLPQ